MTTFRITKYNPKNRNDQGHYLDNSEWTAISDLGKSEYNNVTFGEYEKVESAYVSAIKIIMLENNLDFLKIDSLEFRDEKKDFKKYEKTGRLENINVDFDKEIKNLKNGLHLNFTQLDKIIRLILRETIWMRLVNKNVEVDFGYDYYMYVKTKNISKSTSQEIEKSGLFIEPNNK